MMEMIHTNEQKESSSELPCLRPVYASGRLLGPWVCHPLKHTPPHSDHYSTTTYSNAKSFWDFKVCTLSYKLSTKSRKQVIYILTGTDYNSSRPVTRCYTVEHIVYQHARWYLRLHIILGQIRLERHRRVVVIKRYVLRSLAEVLHSDRKFPIIITDMLIKVERRPVSMSINTEELSFQDVLVKRYARFGCGLQYICRSVLFRN